MFTWFDKFEDRLFTGSRTMGPPWGPVLRVIRYPAALLRDWLQGEISVRAMSLAYTTLLSIVPLMVFSFSILKGLGARGDLRFILDHFFQPLGAASEQLTESVLQFVGNMSGVLLGSLGLAFLVYTVIATIEKVEKSFNFLWRVDQPRSFARRFTEYLSVMILGPILLAVVLGLLASAESSPFALWLDAIKPLAWLLGSTGKLLPYLIVTVIFTFMYAFIPNTNVQLRAALIGGITAGVIWALVGKAFAAFIVYSATLVAVYTGFAIVLTTLIWVYLCWLILLIGAQLAFYVQFPQYLRHGQADVELTGRDREQAALSVMYLIGRDYAAGKIHWTPNALASELDIPSILMAPILNCLEKAGLLVMTEEEQFVPGRDIAAIQIAEVLDTVRAQHSGRLAVAIRGVAPALTLLQEAETAMRMPLHHLSLKDLTLRP
ncbi:MAG: YihY/virulence factor BrkB family protein [Pseudomonadota bacterium]|nr:YihY/virulence factor BrkB family protein [Pseudomonadota bacterium]